LFAEADEEFKALELVLDRVLHLCKAQFDVRLVQVVVEFGYGIGCGNIAAPRGDLRASMAPCFRRLAIIPGVRIVAA
jgi:hypothetical protein